jgi:hypothetical protein
VNGDELSVCGLDLFGFNVERLPDFSEAARLRVAIFDDVSRDLVFLSVSEGLNAGVNTSTSSHLDIKRARKEECSQGKYPSQAGSSPHKISC